MVFLLWFHTFVVLLSSMADSSLEFTLVPLSHHLWRETVVSHEVSEANVLRMA